MQNLRLIKKRIKSAKNIAQITKAMELVSASKMKKAIAAAESGRLYAEKIREMVMILGSKVDRNSHPLLKKPSDVYGRRFVVLISTNKGLCGGLNTSLFRHMMTQYQTVRSHRWATVGAKGAMFLSLSQAEIVADFSSTSSISVKVPAIAELVINQFLNGSIDGVDLVYNDFQSVFKQIPRVKSILPLTIDGGDSSTKISGTFLIEPNPESVFAELLPSYIENQIRDALLEAEASEHAARMVAMRNATDNAKSFISELTLVYNKGRQEKITNEIADLVTARSAIVTE
ncbi:MAG: ATP synthase F1 subunit gamma [Patescibacteria group bacterium]|nr:ATP synthase F1 subunit gamma [Patescibacteria group bacterium]